MLIYTLSGVGCAYYPTPEEQTGILSYVVVDSQEEVDKLCNIQRDEEVRELACASKTRLVVNRNDWERHIIHEMAHIFGVLSHE